MTEGKYKTNVKPEYLQCKNCNYYGPYYNFEKGFWIFKRKECPKCGSYFLQNFERPKIAPAPGKIKTNNK